MIRYKLPFLSAINREQGFTILELTIVIIIMGILSALTVTNVIKSQVTARDKERVEDISSIARHFNSLYNQGLNSSNPSLSTYNQQLSYPSTLLISSPTSTIAAAVFDEIDPRALQAPKGSSGGGATHSLVNATSTTKATISNISPMPSATNDVYVYQPLNRDDTLCTSTTVTFYIRPDPTRCVKFQIFYYDEASQSVKVKSSVNQ